jgi:hypothetical protein
MARSLPVYFLEFGTLPGSSVISVHDKSASQRDGIMAAELVLAEQPTSR